MEEALPKIVNQLINDWQSEAPTTGASSFPGFEIIIHVSSQTRPSLHARFISGYNHCSLLGKGG